MNFETLSCMHRPPHRGRGGYSCGGRGGHSRNYPSDAFVQRPPQFSYFSGYQPWTDATDYQNIEKYNFNEKNYYTQANYTYQETNDRREHNHQKRPLDKTSYNKTPSKISKLNSLKKQNQNTSEKTSVSSTNSSFTESGSCSEDNDQEMNDELPYNTHYNQQPNRYSSRPLNQLPALRLRISEAVVDHFKNPISLSNEIIRCKKINDRSLKIKFASLKESTVLIATDDQDTFDELRTDWPEDAFIRGVKIVNSNAAQKNPNQPKIYKIVIKSVHPDIDLNDESVSSQLTGQGLTKFHRITNKDGKVTSLVKAEIVDLEKYKSILKNGLYFGFSRTRAIEPDRPPNQCFKCQAIGHSSFDCREIQRCAKCSGPHNFKDCDSENIICANCKESHWALSRSCPVLLESQKTKSQGPSKSHSSYRNIVQSQFNLDENHLTKLICKIVEKTIGEKLEQIATKIMDTYNLALANTLEKLKTNNNEPLLQLKECLLNNLAQKEVKEIVQISKSTNSTAPPAQQKSSSIAQSIASTSSSGKSSNSKPSSTRNQKNNA